MTAMRIVAFVVLGLSGALTKALVCLDDDSSKLKFVNEPCENDSDCYNHAGSSSTACEGGRCVCNKRYLEENLETTLGDKRTVCSSMPRNGDKCKTKCALPYTCAPVPQTTTSGGSTAALSTGKVCQCLPPYVEKNGNCLLACKEDEFYADGDCKKRCSPNEYLVDNECQRTSGLHGPCKVAADCSLAYSECRNGKCACVGGFAPNKKNDACQSDERTCPLGEPLLSNGAAVKCNVTRSKTATKKAGQFPFLPTSEELKTRFIDSDEFYYIGYRHNITDDCPDDYFCMVTDRNSYVPGATGHCCRTPKPACPIGKPHPNGTCGLPRLRASHRVDSDTVTTFYSTPSTYYGERVECPVETHSCHLFAYGGGFQVALCCPFACPRSKIYFEGLCLPKRDVGDQCDVDDQCLYTDRVCKNGKCDCGSNTTLIVTDNTRKCEGLGKDKPANTGTGVVVTMRLGEKCQYGQSRCGLHAKCSDKSHTCICDCGKYKLGDKHCGPKPQCAVTKNSVIGSKKVDLGSHTFCIPPGKDEALLLNTSFKAAVKQCPHGHFCADYISLHDSHLGVCCQKPEKPVCDDGTVAEKTCDPKKSDDCGKGKQCVKTLDPARAADPYVCCSPERQPIVVNEDK